MSSSTRVLLLASFALALPVLVGAPADADAAVWEEATAATIGATAEWSNKVELADINGDGLVDILFANGRGYSSDDGPEVNRAFLNQGPGNPFVDMGAAIFGAADRTRVIKARDVDGDGIVDLFVGNTWETESRLYLGDGGGVFTEVTATNLPQLPGSIGDAELGDVDGDGDLDLVLADWGAGNPSTNAGGRTRLYLGDGTGAFVDATAAQMPDVLIGWSWELELTDVDNDYDLDVLVSCKSCAGSALFVNNGAGAFTDASAKLPQFGNNYEFEGIDLSGDGFIDLITINDKDPGTREHIFVGDGAGGFVDQTAALWPDSQNPAGDDNMIAFLDVDSDGDADFVIAGLFGQPDRLMINDGAGNLTVVTNAFAPSGSQGSLGIAVADLDGDHKLDVVISEGEAAFDDHVFLGVDIPADTAAPKIDLVEVKAEIDGPTEIRARVHDNKTPVMDHDFAEVRLEWDQGGSTSSAAMRWYGGLLWRGELDGLAGGALVYRVCARDVAGNEACSADQAATVPGGGETTGGTTTSDTSTSAGTSDGTSDGSTGGETGGETGGTGGTGGSATTGGEGDDKGCACWQGGDPAGALALVGLVGLVGRRRRSGAR